MSVNTANESLLQAEVVKITRELIRIDTTNYGDDSGPGEALAAEYVTSLLSDAGIDSKTYDGKNGRHNVIARIPGTNSTTGALAIHGHLDVVPAVGEWKYPAFSGEIADAMIWGRGAIDMKSGCATTLATIRHWQRLGKRPKRDLVLMFTADEEAGSRYGAHWLVENARHEFENVTEAVGEVGGFSYSLRDDLQLYFIEAAQKGIAWLEIHGSGTAGHGSMIANDNAVVKIAEAISRIGSHKWPIRLTDTVRLLLQEVSEITGIPLDENHPEEVIATLGSLSKIIGATVRHTANPTMLTAGYKTNVIPADAMAVIDGRFLPGLQDDFMSEIRMLVGDGLEIRPQTIERSVETTFDGKLVDAIKSSILAEDPAARILPYTLSGGTDAKALDKLGIRCFGFAPLKLPAGLDFAALFHGVNERVPVSSLEFGARVFDRFLEEA
jgi:acetylornithine deacetylase/succinyl-diaminopimelate desuccinylase-like protein